MNNKCPWCGSDKAQINLWLKDEFLTKEDFHICECLSCGLLYTMPRPSKDKIGEYYKSEEYYSHQENKKGFIPKLYEKVKKVNLKHKYELATKGLQTGKLLEKSNNFFVLNIYKRNISKSIETEHQENSLQVYKEDGIFKKIWNKIISFFRK